MSDDSVRYAPILIPLDRGSMIPQILNSHVQDGKLSAYRSMPQVPVLGPVPHTTRDDTSNLVNRG